MQAERAPGTEPEAAAVADAGFEPEIGPPIVVGIDVPVALPAFARSEMASLAVAVLLHIGLIVPMLAPDDRIGGGGADFEAIGVEIVARAPAVEAREGARGRGEARTGAVVRDRDGDSRPLPEETASRDARAADQEPPQENAPPPADLVVPLWQEPVRPPDATANEPVIAPQRSSGTANDAPTPPRQTPSEVTAATSSSIPGIQIVPREEGGAAARGRDQVEMAEAVMAAARAGRRDDYGMAVRAAISTNVRFVAGETGVVKIEFWIAPSGLVEQLRIAQSSGSQSVDAAAADAVRRTRFPARPFELTGQTLAYDITLSFVIGQ